MQEKPVGLKPWGKGEARTLGQVLWGLKQSQPLSLGSLCHRTTS